MKKVCNLRSWFKSGLTCSQGGQNQSPSGIIIRGGRKQAVWYPASHLSHSRIWKWENVHYSLCDEWAASWENQQSAYAKTKTQISFAVTAKLISAFVFATRIVQFLFYLNPKFQASSSFLCLYRPVCVGPVRKPHCWFSHEEAHIMQSS